MSAIDDYLDKHATASQRKILGHIRSVAVKLVPEPEEVISYGIPTIKYKGKYVIYFAAFKNHLSIFPGAALTDELKAKLNGFKVAKGTIQFTEDNPLPDEIIEEIVSMRLRIING